jgi:hypothetical protein
MVFPDDSQYVEAGSGYIEYKETEFAQETLYKGFISGGSIKSNKGNITCGYGDVRFTNCNIYSISGNYIGYSDDGEKLEGFLTYTAFTHGTDNSFVMDSWQFLGFESNSEERISALESWQQTINNTLTSIQNSITSILNTLTGYNTRISKLENSTSNGTTIINNTTIVMGNGTNPYLKYLSSSIRKSMVCGLAENNNLTSINDLGWNCTITYKTTRGRTTSSCKCK